jgi:hypothetical protein
MTAVGLCNNEVITMDPSISPEENYRKELVKPKDVPDGDTTQGELLILLPCAWVRVQAKLFPPLEL